MRILIGTRGFHARGGPETYLETVAPELRQLGHEVELYGRRPGQVADRLRGAGFTVHQEAGSLPGGYDVGLVQHASVAYALRGRYPSLPLVFLSHGRVLDIDDPPWAARVSALVGMTDRVIERLRASADGARVPVHRLRQPISIQFNEPGRTPIAERPARAVVFSRKLSLQQERLERACDAAGISLKVVASTNDGDAIVEEMMAADVVFASGRTLLEGLALARAGFNFDEYGTMGWVTPESYAYMERYAFAPGPEAQPVDVPELVEMIGGYNPDLGRMGRELVARHHSARLHATELVEILREAAAAPAPDVPSPSELLTLLADATDRVNEGAGELRASQWQAAQFHGHWHREKLRREAAEARVEELEGRAGLVPRLLGRGDRR